MFRFFTAVPVHLKIYSNQMELTNLCTGELRSATSLQPFTTERILLSQFGPAVELARRLAKELRLRNKRLKILVQPMRIDKDGLSEIEKRALRDLAEQMGATQVYIVTEERTITTEEAAQILEEV
jgi:exonuclease VII small subunit